MSKTAQLARKILTVTTNARLRIYDQHFSPLTLVSASEDGTLHCQWKVDSRHVNSGGTLHGGLTASLVDEVTGISLMVKDIATVSTEINVSYLRPAREGELLDIHSKITKAGKSMVFVEADFVNSAGKLVATGKHTVAILHDVTVKQLLNEHEKMMD